MIHLIQQYFSQSALRFPDKVAVTSEDKQLTFAEVDAFTNAFARKLKALGAKRGDMIPFFMKKSVNSAKSFLSILKADCAYVPIDSNSPAQRLEAILKASSAGIVIVDNGTEAHFKALLPSSPVVVVNVDTFAGGDTSPIVYENLSIDLAYVLFTSGSTGTPKGVMVPHKAIIDYIDWSVEFFNVTENDQIANHVPLYFDVSVFDIYCAFKTGATLHFVPEELNAMLPLLVRWLNDRSISILFCVPSVLIMLLKSRRLKPGLFSQLRHLIAAGEVLPPAVISEWMKLYPHLQCTNMYGPTEITVVCTHYVIPSAPDADCTTVPIGVARGNMELLVRTVDGEISKTPGAEGELLVRGTAVTYGYLGDEDRTRQVFIQNPQHNRFHDPLYCTGDLVRIDATGNIIYIGRMDTQIKFMGYRIELGEIEAIIGTTPGVDEAVVVFNNSANEDEKFIGCMVAVDSSYSLEQLRHDLKTRLPAYMVPARIVEHVGDYPRTPSGKYDRKAILGMLLERGE